MISPPAKFDRFPLSAIPMATPAEASSAANEVVCTPSAPTTEMINSTIKVTLTRLPTNVFTDGSKSRLVKIRRTSLFIIRIINRPTTNTITALMIVHPK